MGTLAFRLFKIAVVIVVLVSAYYLLIQDRIIYYPRSYGAEDMARLEGAGGKSIEFKTSQGEQFAYYLPAQGGAKPVRTWLCFCGNGGTALDWIGYLDVINSRDAFLLIDYPGYGKSKGKPSPSSIEENVAGAMNAFIADSGTTLDALRPTLRVFGQSLGCAAALMAADEFEIEKGVLVSPFTSTMDVAKNVVGRPIAWLLRHRFDNVARLQKIQDEKQKLELAVFHGENDEIVPLSMGKMLASKFPKMATLEVIEGAGHNDILHLAEEGIAKAMRN